MMKPHRVLIVDDQPGVRALLREVLTGQGLEVSESHDGPSALSMLDECAPQLVLLDVRMPGMSGLAVLREMRRRGYRGPVLVLTAYQEEEIAADAAQMGPLLQLAKPFDLDALEELIRQSLPADEEVDSGSH